MQELRELKARLEKEKAAIQKKSAPLRAKYDALQQQIAPLEAEARAIAKRFHAIERPRLAELDNQISAIARGMGGKTFSSKE